MFPHGLHCCKYSAHTALIQLFSFYKLVLFSLETFQQTKKIQKSTIIFGKIMQTGDCYYSKATGSVVSQFFFWSFPYISDYDIKGVKAKFQYFDYAKTLLNISGHKIWIYKP